MGITEAIAKYISENKLSVTQIEQDTGIDLIKLQPGCREHLASEEMLYLCQYLRIRPERLMEQYGDQKVRKK
jgi:hypothetical protein